MNSVISSPHPGYYYPWMGCFLCLVLGCLSGCGELENHSPSTRFTALSAAHTGVDFRNDIRETDSLNVLGFEYIFNGGGVGLADLNGDTLPDLILAGNQTPTELYLNRGDLQFEKITASAGLQPAAAYWTTGIAVGDLNGDGLQDIHLANISPRRGGGAPNQLFLHQGTDADGRPRFREVALTAGLADTAYVTQVAFLDYDRDGDLDVYLLRNALESFNRNTSRPKKRDGSAPSIDCLLRNDGNDAAGVPHFTDVSQAAGITVGGWGLGVTVTDLNQDGWPDIYCANDFLSNDLLWINQRDGTFRNEIDRRLPYQSHNSMGVDVADFDNDGALDVVTVDMNPADNLREKTMIPPGNYRSFAMNLRLGYEPQFLRNMLFRNLGDGHFHELGQYAGVAATDWSWAPLLADFDNDGRRDLFITNGYVRDVTDLDFISFNEDRDMFGGGDDRRDRIRQLAVGLQGVKIPNRLFHNQGDWRFTDRATEWGLGEDSYANGAAYGDLDGDGDLDLVVNKLNDPVGIYRNNSRELEPEKKFLRVRLRDEHGGVFGARTQVQCFAEGVSWTADNVRIRGYQSTVEESIHFGLGTTARIDSLVIRWPGGERTVVPEPPVNVRLTYFAPAAAPKYELPEKNTVSTPVPTLVAGLRHQENDYFDFDVQPLVHCQFSRPGPVLETGDWNGDGREDVLFGPPFCLRLSDNDTYREIPLPGPPESATAVLTDADGDGDEDVLLLAAGNEWPAGAPEYHHYLYRNDGKGNFVLLPPERLPLPAAPVLAAATADFDGDGRQDIFVGGSLKPQHYPRYSPSTVLLNRSEEGRIGYLPLPVALPADVGPVRAVRAFHDRVILVTDFGPPTFLRVVDGKCQLEVLSGAEDLRGWWRSLAVVDVDADGDLDVIAGNQGQNHALSASADQPVSLHLNDYDANGRADPVLSRYYADAREYPVAPRGLLTQQMPGIKRRFTTYRAYAEAGMAELFTAEERHGEIRYRATHLESTLLINAGDGTFSARPLPRLAQQAPLTALLPTDLDGDGDTDLLALCGDRSGNVRLGYADGVPYVFLLNDGRGNFLASPVSQPEWDHHRDGRALARLRDGSLVVAPNDGWVFALPPPIR